MLPTVEPAAQRAVYNEAPAARQAHEAHVPTTEILGNTVDPFWRFSTQTVPTRCSLTMPGGLPFGFVVQPFAAPEDSSRLASTWISPPSHSVPAFARVGCSDSMPAPLCRWLRREGERCQGCGAFRNLYVAVEAQTGRWLCNFCGHVTTSDDIKGKDAIDACRELRDAVVRLRQLDLLCGSQSMREHGLTQAPVGTGGVRGAYSRCYAGRPGWRQHSHFCCRHNNKAARSRGDADRGGVCNTGDECQ